MHNRDAEKKRREIAYCLEVCHTINRLRGTDYEPRPSLDEPADVVLISESGEHAPIPTQVVTIPLDFRHRDDNQNIEKFKETLRDTLFAGGLRNCLVGPILSGEAQMKGVPRPLVKQLAEIVLHEASRNRKAILTYDDILARAPELAEYIHEVHVFDDPVVDGLDIDIPSGSAFPGDGQWIEEGIRKKVEKYGGDQAVAKLMLVIGGAGHVDTRQIEMYYDSGGETKLPFLEIWIVPPFRDPVCLKPRGVVQKDTECFAGTARPSGLA